MGVPQGGIISPLLSNLILHELDTYIENLMAELNKKNRNVKPYLTNPKYHKLTMRINRLKTKIKDQKLGLLNSSLEIKEYLTYIRERRKLKSLINNPKYLNIKYVRYADDWMIGVWGSKQAAITIKNDIAKLLKNLKLDLSIEKTLITNVREKRAKFLGTFITKIASTKSS